MVCLLQVLIVISGFCGFCSRIGNAPCTTPFDFLFVISICIPMWVTTRTATFKPTDNHFNPRSRVGNDCNWVHHTPVHGIFQSTFPRGERLHGWEKAVCTKYFNSRSHVGNDKKAKGEKLDKWISIHVPTWGTTKLIMYWRTMCFISIHVPTWGTTKILQHTIELFRISIHVPTWGTTANFHKYSLLFYAINIIFLLFIIPPLFSLVLFVLLFWYL